MHFSVFHQLLPFRNFLCISLPKWKIQRAGRKQQACLPRLRLTLCHLQRRRDFSLPELQLGQAGSRRKHLRPLHREHLCQLSHDLRLLRRKLRHLSDNCHLLSHLRHHFGEPGLPLLGQQVLHLVSCRQLRRQRQRLQPVFALPDRLRTLLPRIHHCHMHSM